MGDEVPCRLVATKLAIGERLDVTQSTPTLMVAWLLLAIASLHVDENEDQKMSAHLGVEASSTEL